MLQWPPTPGDLYLEPSPHRLVFQGDIFADVPFIKAQGGDTPDADPRIRTERRLVTPILYPCDMYVDGRGVLGRVQAVALVHSAEGVRIPDDWAGAFTVCPLPDLMGDGAMWLADFRAIANVDRSYLRVEHRVHSLTEAGWAVFRQRLALASTRLSIDLDDLRIGGAITWEESVLWQRWNEAGRDPGAFHDWYDGEDDYLDRMTRRQALERGLTEQVRLALTREIQPAA